MNAIEAHEFSQADHKSIYFDVFEPYVHGIRRSVMLNGNKHLRFNLQTMKQKKRIS